MFIKETHYKVIMWSPKASVHNKIVKDGCRLTLQTEYLKNLVRDRSGWYAIPFRVIRAKSPVTNSFLITEC